MDLTPLIKTGIKGDIKIASAKGIIIKDISGLTGIVATGMIIISITAITDTMMYITAIMDTIITEGTESSNLISCSS